MITTIKVLTGTDFSGFVGFIDHWQTLIGALAGPFLAVIVSVGIARRDSELEKERMMQDAIRTIDTSIIETLNSLYSTRLTLEIFLKTLNEIIKDVDQPDARTFAQNETNFPITVEIFINPILPELQTGSNYLHNQLMFYNAGLRQNNAALNSMKESLKRIFEKNELSCEKNEPIYQRKLFTENLELYYKSVKEFNKTLEEGCRVGQQIKVYNEKLGRSRLATIQEFENIAKAFYAREKWKSNFNRVNEKISVEVEEAIKLAEVGLEQKRSEARKTGSL